MPSRSTRDGETFGASWFAVVPAYRLATLRVALAVTTIAFHVPKFNGLIDAYVASAFHVPPAFAWIPPLTPAAAMPLAILQHVAGWGLLFGWWPRFCAWLLVTVGLYVMALDPEHYAHNAQFHLTLLALIGCSTDRVALGRLLEDDGAEAGCPAWPERLVRIQVAIVFLYAAFDKVLSPHWGLSGGLLAAQRLAPHAPGLAWLQSANEAVLRAFPGMLSTSTIALEFFMAVAFLVRPLWRAGIMVALVFGAYLEFMLRPGAFAWDMMAALLAFVPAGDRSWTAAYAAACPACRWNRSIISRCDWLRRLRWDPRGGAIVPMGRRAAPNGAREALTLVSPRGRVYQGFDALRVLPIVLLGPVFVVMALARFGGGFLASQGFGPWYDLPFALLGGLLLLWIPGLAQFGLRPLATTAATILSRLASGLGVNSGNLAAGSAHTCQGGSGAGAPPPP
jgi:Vitamin K-dependent gamma-carboxylase